MERILLFANENGIGFIWDQCCNFCCTTLIKYCGHVTISFFKPGLVLSKALFV